MKSFTLLICVLLFSPSYCAIVDSIDTSIIDAARRPPRSEMPAPSQWIGLDDFLEITESDRLKDLDPKNANAEVLLKEARSKGASYKNMRRSLPTFESLGLNQEEAVAEA